MKINHDKSLSEIWARFAAQPDGRDIAWRMGRMAPYTHLEQSQSCYNLEPLCTATNRCSLVAQSARSRPVLCYVPTHGTALEKRNMK